MRHQVIGLAERSGVNKQDKAFFQLTLHTKHTLKGIEGTAVKVLEFWNDEAKELKKSGISINSMVDVERDDTGRIISVEIAKKGAAT